MSQQQVKPVLKASQNFHNAEVRALFQKDIHDVFRWAELLQLTSEEEMIAAEARADAIELINFKKRLKVLLELCLYLSLILETSTSKQTRRSQEDKCIVHILLLRSGVESNPGPRTWIANNVQEQQLKPRDVANHISARMVDVKIAALIAENQELKRIATLEPGAQKRNAEEGETSTDVKKVKQQ
ncbi:hypothetical protein MAR_033355 [Mya arenaria]|uniref:Uncharacterized protein n=1 Tax=Mya arenaria TaxID=6604 RepID=A0ABY7G8Q6_MYAAR|nr:hypothetical protein MAR_033355 [Mya arenaria]